MSAKPRMVAQLGESTLLLPQLLEEALAANDRLKVCFTLLQAAERHADDPGFRPDLVGEVHTARLDGALGESVTGSRR